VDICNQFVLIFPEDEDALKAVDLSKDRSGDLERVEQQAWP